MKKIILATLTLLGVMSVNAQKNSILLGTDFSYQRENGFNDKNANKFTFSPIIAYEIGNNWFLGAKTSLSYSESSTKELSSTTNEVSSKTKNKEYNTKVGGFIRYYKPFNNTFGIYADLGAGYIQNRSDESTRNYTNNTTTIEEGVSRKREYGYYIDFVPALFINFKDNFGLNLSFGGVEWKDTKENEARKYENSTKTRNFDLTFGKSINIGVTKKFSL